MAKKKVASEEKRTMVNPSPPVVKAIHIDMVNDREPYIRFEGKWNGKDLSVVLSTLKRQYPLYIRGLRRNHLYI